MSDYTDIKALNWSTLKLMADSPLLYSWRQSCKPVEDKPAYVMGRAVHVAILEPDRMDELYVQQPDWVDRRTKKGKEWLAEQDGREVLTPDQWATAEGCARAVAKHGDASALLADTQRELTVEWKVENVECKGRVDAVKRMALPDLKTCRSLERFERDAAQFLYRGQLAFYFDGARAAGLLDANADAYIIAVETGEPHDVAAFRLPDWHLQQGRNLYQRLLATLLECERTNTWPGRFPGVTDLDLPRWADDEGEGEDW